MTLYDTHAHTPSPYLVVGLGASAGGVETLSEFFAHVPADSGMVYVVILHLSPDHDSQLAEILQTVTPLPVTQVTKRVRVEPGHVYVVPPNQHLLMEGGHLAVSPNIQIEDRRAPVDIFFRTLAESHGTQAVAVVLSGTGANGSMGLKRVKERGGAVFVQSPREAAFNEMPRNAIATELVDDVLPVADIPDRIVAYAASLHTVAIPLEAAQRRDEQQQALREVFSQLRAHTGHDFSNYKRPTLLRRIERRITLRNLPDLPSYAVFLRDHPDETPALLKDLLISVTNFFRDREPFETLETDILPRVFASKRPDEQVRIWVVGCASGEEAYSLAMLCAERSLRMVDAPSVQIFASDIDEAALAHARAGLYTLNDAADVSPERLRRFFTLEDGSYRIRRELRDTVLFANHNVLKDPPFGHLDLITCRNLLIYLNQTAQERVLETLHFALNPGGYLLLGTAESIEGAGDLFATISHDQHIFQSRQTISRPYPLPERVLTVRPQPPSSTDLAQLERRTLERISYGDLHQRLLEQYAPPSLVVNETYEIVHLSERAGRYLQVGGGEPSTNLLALIRPELRLPLRSALYQAAQGQMAVEARDLPLRINEQSEVVTIRVRPVLRAGDPARGFLLVLFEPGAEAARESVSAVHADETLTQQLEAELVRVKAQLRASSEQYEYQTEELKASNEELQAINEELRSTAEELETSKEELQSINEELRTVNQELKIKVDETTLANNNLQNLINSSDIGTIFLDRGLRVAFFTPAARAIFNLISADHGRSLADITHRLVDADVLADAETVLDRLHMVEREVQTSDERSFLMRLLPYRTDDDRIGGVIIAFVDISARLRAEEALRRSEERLRLLIESATDYSIFTTDARGVIDSWSEGARHMFGWTTDEAIGQPGEVLFTPEDRAAGVPQQELATAREQGRALDERFHVRKDGSRFYVSGSTSAIRAGGLRGFVKIARDLTERKQAEEALRESEARFRTLSNTVPQVIWANDAGGKAVYFNQRWFEYSGLSLEESIGPGWQAIVHPDDAPASIKRWQEALAAGEMFDAEYRLRRADGVYRWHVGRNVPLRDPDGRVSGWFGTATDVEDLKQAEDALQRANAALEVQVVERSEALAAAEAARAEAEAALGVRDQFLSIASHELRTPLSALLGYAHMLPAALRQGKGDPMRMADRIAGQAQRLNALIDQLLDVSRLQQGQFVLDREPVDLAALLDRVVDEFRSALPASGEHVIALACPPEPLIVVGDTNRLEQVLENLLSNAVKYSPEGGTVHVRLQRTATEAVLEVQDEGIGIPAAACDQLFAPFYRAENVGLASGFGLGLHIVREIVQRHGGSIAVESAEGQGSIFRVTLPLGETGNSQA